MNHLNRRVLLAISALFLAAGCGDSEGSSTSTPSPDAGTSDVTIEPDTTIEPDPVAGSCERTLEAPESGLCAVIPGDDRLLIEGDLILLDGLLERGQVLVAGDQIVCVGCDCEEAGAGAPLVSSSRVARLCAVGRMCWLTRVRVHG